MVGYRICREHKSGDIKVRVSKDSHITSVEVTVGDQKTLNHQNLWPYLVRWVDGDFLVEK